MNETNGQIEAPKAPSKKKSIARFFLDVLVYIVIVGGIVFGLPKFLSWYLNTPYPMAAITSGSMWPALKEGDLVFIQGVSKEAIGVGDIIVYRNGTGGGFTIHRVVRMKDDTLTTKGDANFGEDAPVKYDQVVGRTFELFGKPLRIPYLGSVTTFTNNLRDAKNKPKT